MNRLFFSLVTLGLSLLTTIPIVAQSTLYKAGKVFTMEGEPLIPGAVLVRDGKIEQVGQTLQASAGVDVVDLGSETVLLPGLVNAYSQAGLSVEGSDEYSREITPEFQARRALDRNSREFQHLADDGITTVCICPGTENVIAGLACVVKTAGPLDSAMLLESAALVTNLCSDPSRRNQARQRPDSIYVRQPTNRMGVVWLFRNTFHKLSAEQEVAASAEPGVVQPIREVLAGDRSLFVYSRKAHDIETIKTLATEFNFSPVIVGGQEAYLAAEWLAQKNYPVILGQLSTGVLRGSEDAELSWNNAGLLAEAGVTFCLSGNDLLTQARFAHRYGLDEMSALQAITITPARLLGVDDRVGSIAAGKDADLIALEGDPLELTSRIRWILVNGEKVENN